VTFDIKKSPTISLKNRGIWGIYYSRMHLRKTGRAGKTTITNIEQRIINVE
jgi:hypothetical protein